MQNDPWEWLERIEVEWLPDDLSITIDAKTVGEQIDRVQGFMRIQHLYRAAISEVTTKLETLDAEYRTRYEHRPIHHIVSRLKSPQSILGKLRRKGLELSMDAARAHVHDIAGVRVICNYVEDIYEIAGILEGQHDVTLLRRTDYIKTPKENGYRSLHLIVQIPVYLSDRTENVPVEVQIRTIAMDFWATLEHELRYKAAEEVAEDVKTRLKACAETSAALDMEMQAIRRQVIREGK